MNILAIAFNTYREALRNKVFYIILLFAIIMISFSIFLAVISMGEQERVLRSVGLSAMEIFGILLAMFVGVNLVYEEMERRTIYTIIASGVKRYEFIIGKFAGLFLTIAATIVFMSIIFIIILFVMPEASFSFTLLPSIYNSLLSLAVVIAVAVLFSSFSTPVLSAGLTLMVYIIGNLSQDILEFGKKMAEDGVSFLPAVTKVIYFIIPHLDYLNIKNLVLAGKPIEITPWPTLYTLGYCLVLLWIASYIFSKKDFK